jgi:hypothetical protein
MRLPEISTSNPRKTDFCLENTYVGKLTFLEKGRGFLKTGTFHK